MEHPNSNRSFSKMRSCAGELSGKRGNADAPEPTRPAIPAGASRSRLASCLYTTQERARSEVARLTVEDLDLVIPMATLHGKGRKVRQCPLWKVTAEALREIVRNRSASQGVFLNRHGQSLTRYGVHILVKRYARQAAVKMPTLRNKRVGPHCISSFHGHGVAPFRGGY